jgi:ABC-2 type transport system permease protein
MNFTYARLEILRTFRNTRFVIFAIAFPVLLFLLQATIFARADASDHGAVAAVLMVNMMAFGTASGALAIFTAVFGSLMIRRYRNDSARA